MWALIINGIVAELTDIDPAGRFHESLTWVECDQNVAVGWTFGDNGFSQPEPQPEITAAPKTCTPAQGLVALFALKNITEDNVLAAIDQIPDPVQQYTAKIGYQRATTWERNSPTMQAMAGLLQLTEDDLDALFSYAVTVQV